MHVADKRRRHKRKLLIGPYVQERNEREPSTYQPNRDCSSNLAVRGFKQATKIEKLVIGVRIITKHDAYDCIIANRRATKGGPPNSTRVMYPIHQSVLGEYETP